jgi:DNA replication protein DnaC
VTQPSCPHGECDGSGFVVDEAANTARPCRCRPQRLARARARSLSAVIPRRYRDVAWERKPVIDIEPSITTPVRRFAADVDDNLDEGRGLWFMGDPGTGKTTLAMLVSKAALEANRTVAIYSLPRLLGMLVKTFDADSEGSYLETLDRLSEVDLLHLDDFGYRGDSPWVKEQLFSVVNTRYEEQRSLIITTNFERDELVDQVGERTVSRLTEMCLELPLFGHDRRQSFAPVD